MRKVSLFIAMSLDGYIADSNGSVDWIKGHSETEDMIDSYSDFIKTIDTVVMGFKTYHQITTDLSPNDWVYKDLKTYVVTHQSKNASDNIIFTDETPAGLVKRLKVDNGKGIWICGGASIAQQLINEDLIDDYYLTVIPTILGSGIRFFDKMTANRELKLVKTQSYNGMVDLVYTKP